jgi:transcriptional regulator with XRE-family HTH domain
MDKIQISVFKDQNLNGLAVRLIQRNKKASDDLYEAQKLYKSALIRHWENGKDVHENYDAIIAECDTQKSFAEKIGITPSQLSNDLRAYKALLEEGVETAKDVKRTLHEKGIKATVSNWERLPRLLNNPEENRVEKRHERTQKDEKRLQELYDEVEEIQNRQESNPNIKEEATYVKDHIVRLTGELLKKDPTNLQWESDAYLEFVRGYGMDIMTGESVSPDARLEPHHVNPFTGHAGGGMAGKVPDCFTVPVTKKTHRQIHDGDLHFTKEEWLEAIITVMSKFIITYGK